MFKIDSHSSSSGALWTHTIVHFIRNYIFSICMQNSTNVECILVHCTHADRKQKHILFIRLTRIACICSAHALRSYRLQRKPLLWTFSVCMMYNVNVWNLSCCLRRAKNMFDHRQNKQKHNFIQIYFQQKKQTKYVRNFT